MTTELASFENQDASGGRRSASVGVVLCVLMAFLNLSASGQQAKVLADVEIVFKQAEQARSDGDFAQKKDQDIFRRQMEAGLDSKAVSLAALQLGKLRDVRFLELMWWRSSDPLVRTFCVAGLVLQPVDDIQLQETKDRLLAGVKRFQDAEARARHSEIALVFENRAQFRAAIWEAK